MELKIYLRLAEKKIKKDAVPYDTASGFAYLFSSINFFTAATPAYFTASPFL